jgi:hypothetical protein
MAEQRKEVFEYFDPNKGPADAILIGATKVRRQNLAGPGQVQDVISIQPVYATNAESFKIFEQFEPNYRKSLAQKLKSAGYYRGPITGEATRDLRVAYLDAQSDLSAENTERLTAFGPEGQQDLDNIETFLTRQSIVNPPTPEREARVGELPASRVPFGGQQVGGATVSGPITSAVKTPTKTHHTKTPTKTSTKTPGKADAEVATEADDEVETPEVRLTKEEILNKYPIIDALFDQDPELKALLNKYLNPKSKMTLDQFKKELGQAQYNFKYADVVKNRMAKKAIFDRLGASATGQSDYEREVAAIAATMEATAIDLGATVTKEDLNRLASNIYLAGTEANALIIERALTPFIKLGVSPITGRPTIGGAAGSNYQALLNTAKANGIKEENLAGALGFNSAEDILRKLAEGEPINTFQQRLRDIAAYGRSDYVKNLLAQGTDFDVIISPYRNLMANVLEIANAETN